VEIQIYGENIHPYPEAFVYHIAVYVGVPLTGELLCLASQIEVFLGEAASIVGRESEANVVVADIDVRMVAGQLGQFADLIHEVQGGTEIFELKGFYEFAGYDLPACEAGEA